MHKPDEPLALSAPLARQAAPRLCRRDAVSGGDCSWYHGLWQDLRAIGLAAAPEHQAAFFLNAFGRLGGDRRLTRVLISGAADYSILAHVLWACREHGLEADITVVDVCETPLFLNQWYADRMGQRIATYRESIFEYRPASPFDVICSHSFLGQFEPQRRTHVVEKWSQWIAPTGIVLAVNRVRPPGGPNEVRFSQDDARKFCETVGQRLGESQSLSETERAEILDRARLYVQRLHSYAITEADLTPLFQPGGFRIHDLSIVVSSDPRNTDISGKAIPKDARHACLIASRQRAGE